MTEDNIAFFRPLILGQYLDAVNLRCQDDDDGAILGFVGGAEQNIEMIFLDPDYMGDGMGRTLLNCAINDLGAIKVDVNEQNPNAVDFYKHCGFEIIGRSETDGMGKPFPLLHMRLAENKDRH